MLPHRELHYLQLGLKHASAALIGVPKPLSCAVPDYFTLLGWNADDFCMPNDSLSAAKRARNDEFYTQFSDIEKEMNAYLEFDEDAFKDKIVLLPCDDPEWSNFTKYFAQNFARLGLRKLISTSYAPGLKSDAESYQTPLFELDSPQFDSDKTKNNGKIFILDRDVNGNGKIDIEDLQWDYLQGDGDFRSPEVRRLRDESDIIATNPPFSLFREFLAWITEANKQFAIIGNVNATTYKEVFPLLKDNKIWWGASPRSMTFTTPENVNKDVNSVWFTNLEHGRRHEPLALMTTKDNLRYNNAVKDSGYQKYDNYDAIEVPKISAIPSDHQGVMGVPITFLSKYSPDQFEIVKFRHGNDDKDLRLPDGKCPYFRILIKHKAKKGAK